MFLLLLEWRLHVLGVRVGFFLCIPVGGELLFSKYNLRRNARDVWEDRLFNSSLVVISNSLMFCTLGKLAVTAVSHCIISVLFVPHMLITQIILLIHILIICSFYLIYCRSHPLSMVEGVRRRELSPITILLPIP